MSYATVLHRLMNWQAIIECHLIVYGNAALLHDLTLYVILAKGLAYNPVESN